jgi:Ca2+-binding RTX toxin-like protein
MAIINGTKFDDTLPGSAGDDTIKGAAGNDTIDGGTGNDLVIGGLGADIIQLGGGNDRFQWSHPDWNDVIEGGAGFDTGIDVGIATDQTIEVNFQGGILRLYDWTGIGGPFVTMNDVERLEITPLGGADTVRVQNTNGSDLQQVAIDLASTIGGKVADTKSDYVWLLGGLSVDEIAATKSGSKITVTGLPVAVTVDHVGTTDVLALDGGFGADTIDASKLPVGKLAVELYGNVGEDVIYGTDGADFVDGGSGNDLIFLNGGNDKALWDSLAGEDYIEGHGGTDTVVVEGEGGTLSIFAVTDEVRYARSSSGQMLRTHQVERIEVRSDGDGDAVVVQDLTGTGVTQVAVELAWPGATTGNGKLDLVSAYANAANNVITTKLTGSTLSVTGLPTQLSIAHADGDRLGLDGGNGHDSIDVSAIPTKVVSQFFLSGGNGRDTIRGSVAADSIDGGNGNDLLLWNYGDGSDTVRGGAGLDTLRLTGAATDEQILLGSILGQTQLVHGPDNATLTLQDVEHVQMATLGGADVIVVQNLAGTGIADVAIDLAATVGGKTADTKSDGVAFSGTSGGDLIVLSMLGSKVTVNGLAVAASVDHVGATDIITIIGGGAPDLISAGTIGAG